MHIPIFSQTQDVFSRSCQGSATILHYALSTKFLQRHHLITLAVYYPLSVQILLQEFPVPQIPPRDHTAFCPVPQVKVHICGLPLSFLARAGFSLHFHHMLMYHLHLSQRYRGSEAFRLFLAHQSFRLHIR